MSGLRTIAALLVGFLVLVALGASMASCVASEATPPMPGPPLASDAPLTIASTVCHAGLSADARHAALESCSRNGARVVFDQPGYVLCDRGQRSWFTSALDMPADKRGHR